jgi:hypothetical protein
MTSSLVDIVSDPTSGRRRALLLDHHDYAQSVFLQGRPIPWAEPMAFSNFFGQAQGVLKSDIALLPLDRFYAHQMQINADLRQAMSARSRTGFALRTLLADAATTALAVELATIFSKTQRQPVVLQIPSPMQWLVRTHAVADAEEAAAPGDLDADNAENASMYVADWLRGFAALPLAGVLLDDRDSPGESPALPVPLSTYSPVQNVTDHYRWSLALRRADEVSFAGNDARGHVIDAGFWTRSANSLPAGDSLIGDFLVGEIPAAAVPEDVLLRIAALV